MENYITLHFLCNNAEIPPFYAEIPPFYAEIPPFYAEIPPYLALESYILQGL